MMSIFGGGKNKSQNSSADQNTNSEQVAPTQGPVRPETLHTQGEHPMTDAQLLNMINGEDD